MTDLAEFFRRGRQALILALASQNPGDFSGFSGSPEKTRKREAIDNTNISGISGISGWSQDNAGESVRLESSGEGAEGGKSAEGRARESLFKYLEIPEIPEKPYPARIYFSGCIQPNPEIPEKPFPASPYEESGSPEPPCCGSICNFSDTMPELDTARPVIEAEEVLAAFEAARDRFIAERGVSRAVAEASALAFLHGCLLADPRLAPHHWDVWNCFVCKQPKTEWNPLGPFCTSVPGCPVWLHLNGDCHPEHLRRRGLLADQLLSVCRMALAAPPAASGDDHDLCF